MTLELTVIQARHLQNIGLQRPPSPYVAFNYLGKFYATEIQENTKDPKWNCTFKIPLGNPQQSLVLTIFNSNKTDKDEILGQCTIRLQELQTKKLNLTQIPLSNKLSTIELSHIIAGSHVNTYKKQPSWILLRTLQIEGELLVNDTIKINKESESAKIPPCSSIKLTYINKPSQYESNYIDTDNIESEAVFKKLTFFGTYHPLSIDKLFSKQKTLTICLSPITVEQTSVGYVIIQVAARASTKDCLLRLAGPLNNETINGKKPSNAIHCSNQTTINVEYWESTNNMMLRPDCQGTIKLNQLEWKDELTAKTANHKLVQKFDILKNKSYEILLKIQYFPIDSKKQEQYVNTLLELPAIKKPMSFNILKISIKNCFLFEVLESPQLIVMFRDSQSNINFTNPNDSKEYSWQCQLPMVCDTRNDYKIDIMCYDRNLHYGQKMLSDWQNGLIFTMKMDHNTESSEINYTDNFLKYVKKIRLADPTKTKNISKMIDNKTGIVKIECDRPISREFTHATYIIRNVNVKEPCVVRMEIDGQNCLLSGCNYLVRTPIVFPAVSISSSVLLEIMKQETKQCIFSYYGQLSRFLPLSNNKMKYASEKFTIFYETNNLKTASGKLLPQQRLLPSNCQDYQITLLNCTIDKFNCQQITAECETNDKKYYSKTYRKQTKQLNFSKQSFFITFFQQNQPKLLFFTLTFQNEDSKQAYNGHIDINKLYTNGRSINNSVLLFVSDTKQPKGIITINIRPIKCQIYKNLTVKPHYVVQWNDMDPTIRHTLSYIVRMTIDNRQYVMTAKYDKGPIVNMNNFCRWYGSEPAKYHNDLNQLKKASHLQCSHEIKIDCQNADWLYVELFSCQHDDLQQSLKNVEKCTLVAQGIKNIRDLFFQAKRNYHESIELSYRSSSEDTIKYNSDALQQQKAIKFSFVYSIQEGQKHTIKKKHYNIPSSLFPKAIYQLTIINITNISAGSQAYLTINDKKITYGANNSSLIASIVPAQPKQHKIHLTSKKLQESETIQVRLSEFILDILKLDFKFDQHYESFLSDDQLIIQYTMKAFSNRYSDHPEGILTTDKKAYFIENNKKTEIVNKIETHSPYSMIQIDDETIPLYRLPFNKMNQQAITVRNVEINYQSVLVKSKILQEQKYMLALDKYIVERGMEKATVSTVKGITKEFMKVIVEKMPWPSTIVIGKTEIRYNGRKVTKVVERHEVQKITIKALHTQITAIRLKNTNKFVCDDQMFIVDFQPFTGRVFKNSQVRIRLNKIVRIQNGIINQNKLVTFLDSTLADKLMIMAKCNGQSEKFQQFDKQIIFGIHQQTTTVQFQLLIDNIFNRQQLQQPSWMQLLPICTGTLFLPQFLSNQNSINFCLALPPLQPDCHTISNSFSKLLSRQDLYLLGNLSVEQAQWAYIEINSISISNLVLDDKMISIKIELIRQEITEKTVVRSIMSDVREVRQQTHFDISLRELIQVTSNNQSYYLNISLLSYMSTNTVTLFMKRYNITDIIRPQFIDREHIKMIIKPQECRQLKKMTQISLKIKRSYEEIQNSSNSIDNLVDIVDFRHKKDLDLMEVLACCTNNSQVCTTLDEIKESIMFTATNKQDLCQLFQILLKIYTNHTVVSRIVESLEIMLAKQPELIDHMHSIDKIIRSAFEQPNAVNDSTDNIRSIIQCRDWPALQKIIRGNRQPSEQPQWRTVIQHYLNLLNYVRAKIDIEIDALFWLQQVNQHPTTKNKSAIKTLLSYSEYKQKQVYEFYVENNFDDCHDIVYRMYKDGKQDELMFQLHLKRILEKKQWNLQQCSLLLSYVEDLNQEEKTKFKEKLFEQYASAVVQQVKKVIGGEIQKPMILKKLLNTLQQIEKINPQSKQKKTMVEFMKSKEKTMKIERKMMVEGFLKRVDMQTKMKHSRLNKESKKNQENKYLISRLDY